MLAKFHIATRNMLWIYVLENSDADIAMRHTKWIYVSIQIINIPLQPGPGMMRSRVFNPVIRKHESIHVITGAEVEDG
jgi:hypothetical protein